MKVVFRLFRGFLRVPSFRLGLILAVLAVSVLGVCRSIFVEERREFEALKAEAIALQSAKLDLEKRQELSAKYATLTRHLDALKLRFEAEIDRSDTVERVAVLSSRAGTRIIHGANSFGKNVNGVLPVLQDLSVEGSYTQVRAFVNSLSDIETLTFLRSIEFSSNPDGTLVRANLKLITFSARSNG